MAAREIITFADIVTAVREELGIQSGDTKATDKIKTAVNRIYLNKVVPVERWFWLRKQVDVIHAKVFTGALSTSTVAVTEDSTSVTLSDAPSAGLGSFAGFKFKVRGVDERHTIATHTAGATAVVLETKYQSATNATASADIWKDMIDLPTDTRETIDLWHDKHNRPMVGTGEQELRVIRLSNTDREGFPSQYNTDDFFDPTSGTPETEADRFRQVEIFPARNNEDIIIHVRYVQEAIALDVDADEPLMPIEDRDVLTEGTLSIVWRTLVRNPEEAELARIRFETKLNAMAARVEDSFDTPVIAPNSRYVKAQRRIFRRNRFDTF